MKKLFIILLAAVLAFSMIACDPAPAPGPEPTPGPTPGPSPTPEPKAVALTVDALTTEYDTLEEAIAELPAGKEGVIVLNKSVTVETTIVLEGKTVSIKDAGTAVTITDGTNDLAAATNSIFTIGDGGKLTVEGTLTGGITFQGQGKEDGKSEKRTMFNVGPGSANTTAELVIKSGVTVQGIYSTYSGAVMRGYGKMTINGGTFKNNTATVNGCLMCLYGQGTITGGTFTENTCGGNGGFIQVTNTDGVTLTISGGTFTKINGGALGVVVNSYAKSAVTISGGTFTDNVASTASGKIGAAVYCLGNFNISGGTFSGTTGVEGASIFDVYDAGSTGTINRTTANIDKFGTIPS